MLLTICVITAVFYFHPSTTIVTVFFRTVPIVPETIGRVAEIYVGISGEVKVGQPIFRLDSAKQEAALESARRKIAEVEAEMTVARADVLKASSQVEQARSAYREVGPESFASAPQNEPAVTTIREGNAHEHLVVVHAGLL